MQTAYMVQFGAALLLWLTLFAWVKIRFPDTPPGRVLAVIC